MNYNTIQKAFDYKVSELLCNRVLSELYRSSITSSSANLTVVLQDLISYLDRAHSNAGRHMEISLQKTVHQSKVTNQLG